MNSKANNSMDTALDKVKIEIITGDGFIKIRDAARLSRIHPVMLEMGQKLIDSPGKAAARFSLATKDLKDNAEDLKKIMLSDLRKVAGYLGDGTLTPKCSRMGDSLNFWYEPKGHSRVKRSA